MLSDLPIALMNQHEREKSKMIGLFLNYYSSSLGAVQLRVKNLLNKKVQQEQTGHFDQCESNFFVINFHVKYIL